jgi:long-chain acyl-CoA synthetase
MTRFADFLEHLQKQAPQPCLEGDGFSYTYSEMLSQLDLWRTRFDELNVAPGSVVGVRADYSLAAIAALLALFTRRAIAVLIPRAPDTVQYCVDSCAEFVLELDVECGYRWSSISTRISHPLIDKLRLAGDGGVVIFTSGSTGRPKATLQSLERLLYKFRKPGRSFRTLAFLLFDHVAGLDTLLYTLISGGTLILTRHRDPISILELIQSHRVEVLPTSPSFLRLLCAAKDNKERDLSSLKIITYGSEPMDLNTLARLNARFQNVQISQKYGTTETGSPRSTSRGNDSLWLKIKSDSVETKIVDGILWLRSEGIMLGYLNAASPMDEQGWYCTGDMVDVDGEWIKFRGRAADTINVGGEKVAPTEIEELILELDFVRSVLVSGEPHALMGQIVTAQVAFEAAYKNPGEMVKRIRQHCRARLAPYKVPIRIDIVVGEFINARQKMPRTRT